MRPRVLVAEDEPLVRSLLRATLETLDVELAEAVTGRQALEGALTCPPDLLLLDVGLPDLDGYAVCRGVKADPRTDGVVVVLLTGHAGSADRAEGAAAGADDYLTKPFSPRQLRGRVAYWLAGHQW